MTKYDYDFTPLIGLTGCAEIVYFGVHGPQGHEAKDIIMTTDTIEQPQPARSRAVFSQEDFGLIRTAIAHYLKEVQDQPESVKYANLYHRLGRVA
jgi:hypothetical protein